YYSFEHNARFDLTRDRTFTLNETIRDRLATLRGDTDIIIYLPHVSFGQRVELRQDDYDQAAEKIIAKKVEDLAEQFQAMGPRFHVHTLDTQKKTFKERRLQINNLEFRDVAAAVGIAMWMELARKVDSELIKTIEKAPENSVFFYSRDTRQTQ